MSSYSAALAAPPAGEIAEREEDDDDDDDPQDDAEDAPPFDDSRFAPSIRSHSGAVCKRRSAPKGATPQNGGADALFRELPDLAAALTEAQRDIPRRGRA